MNSNKIRFYLIITVCLVLIFNTLRSVGDIYRGGGRLGTAQKYLSRLQDEQKKLLSLKKKVESPDFVEGEARNRLGMAKPGETVVILPENLSSGEVKQPFDEEENWRMWLKLVY